MKVSLSEAYAYAKKIIGPDLRSVEADYQESREGAPYIQWRVMDINYTSKTADTFFEAVMSLKAEIDAKSKPKVEDVVISSEKDPATLDTTAPGPVKQVPDSDLPF